MKFLADESLEYRVVEWLRKEGHDVIAVADELSSMDDVSVLRLASSDSRVLLTNDKDFGDLVFRRKLGHAGVILFRLGDESADSKIEKLVRLFEKLGNEIVGGFVVIGRTKVRLARRE